MNFERLSEFELRQICYFMALVEADNNFSEAASRVGIKQGAFSQRIQALEEKLSTPKAQVNLLDRTTRPMLLTEAGRRFLQEVELALLHLDRAVSQARLASQGELGHLTIGIHNAAANSILPNVLKLFRRRFPQVQLELREVAIAQEISLLKSHQLDVVFHRSPSPHERDPELDCMPLLQESFLVVIPETHRLAKQQQVGLSALQNESIILPDLELLPFYKQFIRLCQEAGFEPNIIHTIQATGIVTLLSLVAAEIGLSILPGHVQVLQRQGVVYRPLRGKVPDRRMTVVWRKNNSSIALRQFLDLVQTVTL